MALGKGDALKQTKTDALFFSLSTLLVSNMAFKKL